MSGPAFQISSDFDLPVVYLQNYCNDETLEGLGDAINSLCESEKNHIVFDLSKCELINSLGLGQLLDVILMITQDYEGAAVVTGINALQHKLFGLTGIFPIAHSAANVEEGLVLLRKLQ